MSKLTLIVFLPVWAVLFGLCAIFAPPDWRLFEYGSPVQVGSVVGTLILAFPLARFVAGAIRAGRERKSPVRGSRFQNKYPLRRPF